MSSDVLRSNTLQRINRAQPTKLPSCGLCWLIDYNL